MQKTLALSFVALVALAIAGGASSSSTASVRLALPKPAADGPFTAQLPVAHAKLTPLARTNEYAASVKIGRSTFRIDEPFGTQVGGTGTAPVDPSKETALRAAQYLVKTNKGLQLRSVDHGSRAEVFAAHRQLVYLTFQAESVEPKAFRIQLTHDAGDGQTLMRTLDSANTRFWLGQTDPKAIASDPAGLALINQAQTAEAAQPQVTVTVAPWLGSSSLKVEWQKSDGYAAGFDDTGALVEWELGTDFLFLNPQSSCWDELNVPSTDTMSPAGLTGYAIKVGQPVQNGQQIAVSVSAYQTNHENVPDQSTYIIDATTHLRISEIDTSTVGNVPSTTSVTFDWTTPIVEVPKPSPVCASG